MEYQQARPASTPEEIPSSQADAALRSVRQTVDQAIANVSDRTREMVRYADRRVQASPWSAVGVSFGLGMVFGVLVALAANSQQRGVIERWRA
jgi:ElaB/YqjD/DUF883 family membrane-anchored ribosome-binding protein